MGPSAAPERRRIGHLVDRGVGRASRVLLDIDVLIDHSWQREPAHSLAQVMRARRDEVGICAVQLARMYSGQERGERNDIDRFFEALPCWAVTPEVGVRAEGVRRIFARVGRAISTPHAIDAAVAWSVGATIVTRNAEGFPMPDVDVLVP